MVEGTVYDGKLLERIFQKQEAYMNSLKEIEAFPDWPFNINMKSHQLIIKDIISRGITELSESFELTQKITKIADTNDQDTPVEPLVREFNEELADSLHFFVEVLILVGIDSYDIDKWYHDYLQEMELSGSFYFPNNTMKTVTTYSRHMNVYQGYYRLIPSSFKVMNEVDEDDHQIDSGIQAGKRVSKELILEQAQELWMLTHSFHIAMNLLKKKKHRNASPDTKLHLFAEALMHGFVRLFKYFDMVGASPISLYENYLAKNTINLKRLKDEYGD